MASQSSPIDCGSNMDYEDEFDLSDPTIDLPNYIWEVMIDLHKRLLTAIPKVKRSYWHTKIEDFYITYFRNSIPKPDELSKTVDEIIDEINTFDEEVNDEPKSSKRKPKSAKGKHKQLIEALKNSLSIGNQSNGTIKKLNFDKLNEAKEVIISIRNELNFHQNQTIKYAILGGQNLIKIQELSQIENKKFFDFLKECGIEWSRSYIHFLISLYKFSKEYPKIFNLSLSIYFIKNNFKQIKLAISLPKQRDFWKAL